MTSRTLRSTPAGRYAGRLISAKFKQKEEDKYNVSLQFRADEALDDVDLDGVQMNQYLYMFQVVTEKSLPIFKKTLKEAGVEVDGKSLKAALAEIEGSDVTFTVGVSKFDQERGKDDNVTVLSFKLAA